MVAVNNWEEKGDFHQVQYQLLYICNICEFISYKRLFGNSLVYGIDVAEFSAYMLNYQHCCF